MKKETISSLQNPLVKGWRALNKSRAERMQAGLFLAEGDHLAGEALKEGKALALLLAEDCQEKYAHLLRAAGALPVYLLSGHVMGAICDAKTPQGAAALCAYPQEDAPLQGDWLIALDGVQDPGNVGTLLRTMDAAGFHGMLLSGNERYSMAVDTAALEREYTRIYASPGDEIVIYAVGEKEE